MSEVKKRKGNHPKSVTPTSTSESDHASQDIPVERNKKSKHALVSLKENLSKGIAHHFLTAAKVLLAVLLVPPFLNYAALQREISHLKPTTGELYDIGWGQKLFLDCQGKGPPTVVLEAPTGMSSDVWAQVKDALTRHSRVCVYDRAGLGFSERPQQNYTQPDGASGSNYRNQWQPFTAERMVDDVHKLLTQSSDQPRPFLFVGAELGAIIAQFYTHLYDSEIMGLVLINPLTETLFAQDNGIWIQQWFGHIAPSYQTLQLGAALGLTRFAIMLGVLKHPLHNAASIDDDTDKRQKHLLCHPRHLSSVVDEHHFVNESFSQLRTIQMLRALPDNITVTVITGNYYDELMPGPLNKAWAKAEQTLISKLSPKAQHIVVNGGDRHMIYKNPSSIIEPVNRIVRQWKSKQRTSHTS